LVPVSIVQCEGNVIGTGAIALSKTTASLARASMFGVVGRPYP